MLLRAPFVAHTTPATIQPRIDVPTRVRWALVLVVLFHGALLISGTFRGTYDAYVHMFLGDHYARDWFSTWDTRWYTGFTTVSYPPGTHMAMAAISKLTGSLEAAFVIVQVLVLALLTIGVYRFSRLWVNEEAAANASLLVVCSSAIAETVHLYGQLPTTFALAFLLNALPFIKRWVFEGRWRDLLIGTTVLSACTAGHHVTTLFGSVFFLGPVLVAGLLAQSRTPADGESALRDERFVTLARRRLRRIRPAVLRGAVLGPCIVAALVIVVLPYWLWSGSDPINQIAIPHGSRANFLTDLNIGLIFFFVPWGLMLLVLPYALVRATVDRMWPLAASILLLFVLGTGGTTPIPKLLLGPAFDILTLDRFTFWAAIMILPLAGLLVSSLEHGTAAAWLRNTGGTGFLRFTQAGLVVALLATTVFSATLSQYRPFQPDPIDPDPIVAFLEKDQHERWRYLTLGFGDQMAWLSAQTTATQVDGNYHSVRRLPELTSTSVERLEGAKYRGVSGLGSLQQFLEVPEKYHLKFVFSNDQFYDPLLVSLGWANLGPLENGVVVWERADIEPLPAELPVREVPGWQRLLWGFVPPAAIMLALAMLLWVAVHPEPVSASVVVDLQQMPTRSPSSWGTKVLARTRARLARPVGRRWRVLRLGLLALFALALAVRLATASAETTSSTDVVEAYFDDLDFRRFEAAYARLDPLTRPDYELWRLQLSVSGGLVSSYAKLDSMTTSVVSDEADRAVVVANLQYLTSLKWHIVDEEVDVVRRGGRWFVVADEPDLVVPPDQLVRRPEVDYLIQGRRRVTSATSDLIDIQDRPELRIRQARLTEHDGLPVVVGEVENLDIDPADLTLTAVLFSTEGEVLGRYNATDHMMRTLLPRESTPFRIDFQRVAAGPNVDFDPQAFSPIEFDDRIGSVEVYAKAVVTQTGLFRGLQLGRADIVSSPDGLELDVEIRNDGVVEATVPIVLVSYLDDGGEVAWVERHYLDDALRPQRSVTTSLRLSENLDVEPSAIDVSTYHNGIVPPGGLLDPLRTQIDLPDGHRFSALRIDLVAMVPAS